MIHKVYLIDFNQILSQLCFSTPSYLFLIFVCFSFIFYLWNLIFPCRAIYRTKMKTLIRLMTQTYVYFFNLCCFIWFRRRNCLSRHFGGTLSLPPLESFPSWESFSFWPLISCRSAHGPGPFPSNPHSDRTALTFKISRPLFYRTEISPLQWLRTLLIIDTLGLLKVEVTVFRLSCLPTCQVCPFPPEMVRDGPTSSPIFYDHPLPKEVPGPPR